MRPVLLVPLCATAVACLAPPAPAPLPVPAPCPSVPIAPAASVSTASPSVDDVEGMVLNRLNAKDSAGLYYLYGDPMRKAFPPDKTDAFVKRAASEWGTLSAPRRVDGTGDRAHAVYELKGEQGDWQLELATDDHGGIAMLKITPLASAEPPVAKSDIPLRLPVQGKWMVFWGGPTGEQNVHLRGSRPKGAPWSQRRAADLVVVGEDGRTHGIDGKRNEDFYAYGRPVVAVADGEVTTVIDGVPENEPGTLNPTYLGGNEVIVRHTPSLYSVYAHLQPGKVIVKPGAKVKRGDTLGRVGNSGNASEPHLHFQLEDGPRFEASWGVEPVFSGVKVTRAGATTKSDAYTFAKGDLVEAAP